MAGYWSCCTTNYIGQVNIGRGGYTRGDGGERKDSGRGVVALAMPDPPELGTRAADCACTQRAIERRANGLWLPMLQYLQIEAHGMTAHTDGAAAAAANCDGERTGERCGDAVECGDVVGGEGGERSSGEGGGLTAGMGRGCRERAEDDEDVRWTAAYIELSNMKGGVAHRNWGDRRSAKINARGMLAACLKLCAEGAQESCLAAVEYEKRRRPGVVADDGDVV
ncbi:hypothetical protein C8R43DRAFT_1157120 [Mycena crocata]|nr:hypothetical protein C8R43DRAFT_1157120 [Mycena crocata]